MNHIDVHAWQSLEPLLERLIEETPTLRAARLTQLEAVDPEAAQSMARLLDAHDAAERDGFLVAAELDLELTTTLAGKTVGSYTVERLLGEGGMGSVWLARRSDGSYEGVAAIKFLHAGLFGTEGARQFRSEGSALARLQHPNIARLFDAGVAFDVIPYLVLEYVPGDPIDQWCDERLLSIESRLRLFVDVLQAVEHAHTHLILHRDLKPRNILVTEAGSVKLLDFGIAKLLAVADGSPTAAQRTRSGPVCTPEYAAPEQLRGEELGITADVYALGVLLYVLLTGRHPYADCSGGMGGLVQASLQQDPPQLVDAAIASSPGENAAVRSARRGLLPGALRRALSGDLESIVMKALQKEPGQRYPSVGALRQDVECYLQHRPVLARRNSASYRAAKFLRRHRLPVALVVFAIVSLIAGVIGTWTQARTARRQAHAAESERERANGAARNAIEQKEFALRQLSRAETVNALNAFLLSEAEPDGRQFSALDLLAKAEDIATRETSDQIANRLEMMVAVGYQYFAHQHNERARRILTTAHDLSQAVADDSIRSRAACALAAVFADEGEAELAEATLAEGLHASSADVELASDRIFCLLRGSEVARENGDPRVAGERAVAAKALLDQSEAPSSLLQLEVAMTLAEAHRTAGRLAPAREAFSDVWQRLERLGRADTSSAQTVLNNWGMVEWELGHPRQAEQLFRRSVGDERNGGRDADGQTPIQLNNLSRPLYDLGRYAEAAEYAERAYSLALKLGMDIAIHQSLIMRVAIDSRSGQLARAESAIAELAARARRSALPETHPLYAALWRVRASFELAHGNVGAALKAADRSLDIVELGAAGKYAVPSLLVRAEARLAAGAAEGAADDARRALELEQQLEAVDEPSHTVGRCQLLLGSAAAAAGRGDEARSRCRLAHDQLLSTVGAHHAETRRARQCMQGAAPSSQGLAQAN